MKTELKPTTTRRAYAIVLDANPIALIRAAAAAVAVAVAAIVAAAAVALRAGTVEAYAIDGSANVALHVGDRTAWAMLIVGRPPQLLSGVSQQPHYDPSIDPAAPARALWTMTDPTPADCAQLRAMVAAGSLAPDAVYDPEAPCVKARPRL